MNGFEVSEPILNSPFNEPALYWDLKEGEPAKRVAGRRLAGYFYRDPKASTSASEHEARGV
jgi:type III restriction enzyme